MPGQVWQNPYLKAEEAAATYSTVRLKNQQPANISTNRKQK